MPPANGKKDLYSVLGVAKGADADVIKKAYRRLARDLHPDKNPGNTQAEARFKDVNHAFDVVGNPQKRALYDEFGEDGLREGFDADKQRAYRSWQQQGGARGGYGGGASVEDMFGGGGGAAGFDFGELFGRPRRRGPSPGRDYESEVHIDFMASVRGTTVDLRLPGNPVPVTVRIPAGADEGTRVRVQGQGGPSPNGGPNGDLMLIIHVEPHKYFRREGDDLHLDLPITLSEAYLGGKVRVPTTEGAVQLKVPEHTQTGSVVRLRGKGIHRKNKETGDLYVHFIVRAPTGTSDDVVRLVKELSEHETEDVRAGIVF
jgi:curved DNA-binding protein